MTFFGESVPSAGCIEGESKADSSQVNVGLKKKSKLDEIWRLKGAVSVPLSHCHKGWDRWDSGIVNFFCLVLIIILKKYVFLQLNLSCGLWGWISFHHLEFQTNNNTNKTTKNLNFMKRKNLFLTFLLAALVLGGAVNSKALAQESFIGNQTGDNNAVLNKGIMGRGNSVDNQDYFSRGGLLGDRSGTGVTLGLTLGGAENENPAPLGSGVVLLMAAGAGYALLKRKEEQQ